MNFRNHADDFMLHAPHRSQKIALRKLVNITNKNNTDSARIKC